ncbi:MAG TPA: dihydroorotate dehydrogenase-like protein [Thermoanaerobaculia bacterium]|nr:dihydroorotate dehydrogenase-like protein [Thermoanaerobaculia bacterium]
MDLSTPWLGLRLKNPLIVGASPMGDDLDTVRRLEDAGAAAIVLHSLFEEQILREQLASLHLQSHYESSAEALSYFPSADDLPTGPDEYLDLIRKVKAAVAVPVVASLNGTTEGGWLHYARLLEEAGADALELNVYALATDPWDSGEAIERRTLAMVRAVREAVGVPVAVKLSPFYTSLAHFARQLDQEGADGLVLFNRFYQPDLDVEELEVQRTLRLSDASELPLRLRWLAILSGRVQASLLASGGVHTALDVLKALMAGAHAVQMVSALLKRGPEYLSLVRDDMVRWLAEHGYESVESLRGTLSLAHCPDPAAYERANYAQVLQTWRAPAGW